MKLLGLALIIICWLFIPSHVDGQGENDIENLLFIEERIRQYEQIMDRYFRQYPATKAQNSYKLAVDKYNALVQTTNATSKNRKAEIENKQKALENLKKQIEIYDVQLVKQSTDELIDQRNLLVEQYNRQLKKIEDAIAQFNEWVIQANQNLDSEKAKLEKIKTSLELEIKSYNEWLRSKKDEEFWIDLNRTFLDLHRKRRADRNNSLIDRHIQKIRNLRKELGTYAIKAARSNDSGLVIISGNVGRKEEFHFIVDTGARHVSLSPVMIEVLGLKERLGEVIDLRLAAGKTARGQKIVFPYVSVLGMEEQDVSGIAIPERKVGIDGLLGRSFLKRFAVCFDFKQGSKIQLKPK